MRVWPIRRWQTPLARAGIGLPLAVVAIVVATFGLPHASDYALRVLSVAGIYALLALGYGFIFGHAGALSLAQGTFMGVGAYVSGILAVRYGIPFDAALPASVGLPVMLALLVAIPVLRLQTHYFALATLLIGQIILLVVTQWESVTGGANGIGGVPPLSLFGHVIEGRLPALLLVWTLVAAGGALAWQITRGRLGDAFAVLRTHPVMARAVGIDTGLLRLTAFLLSAAYAGLAGSLYVHAIGVLSPDILGFPVMVTCLTIAVVGSRLRVAGAIAAAVLIVELPEWARFLRDDYLLAFGGILLLVVVALPGGLTEAVEWLLGRVWVAPPVPLPRPTKVPLGGLPASGGMLLEVVGLSVRFGGVRALDDVSIELRAGEVLGLIGPNGSGKTTLVNAVTGIYPPDAGRVVLAGHDIAGNKPHAIARLGVARTFQTAALVPEMSALDNVAVARGAAKVGLGRALGVGLRDSGRGRARAEAMALLERMGAAQYAAAPARTLPPGIARLVEIARALATEPRLLLLDEPAAGLNETEQADLARRLRLVADDGVGLLVIEHNMPFLAPLADRMACLDYGQLIAAGTPAEVQADPRVIEAYLGAPAAVPA
jgi:branched-chain amino acid transport system permease protein